MQGNFEIRPAVVDVVEVNLEIQDKENRLKQLKDEVQRLEFNIKMLKNSSGNTHQRKKFRRISKKDRKLSLLLKDLKEKAKDHKSMLYNDIESIDEVRKSLSDDIKSIMQLWYFNNDYLVKELGIEQNPTTAEEALAILPKLGINWPPTMFERATEVSYPLIEFDGFSSKWSSERKSRLDMSNSVLKFLSLFKENLSKQRNQLFRIAIVLNDLVYQLDPYYPQLSKHSIQYYKREKKNLFHNNKVLENVCRSLQGLLQGSISEHPVAYLTRPSIARRHLNCLPGTTRTDNTTSSMTTSQPYSGPGPSGTNNTSHSMTTSQPYHRPGPSGTNHMIPSMTTSQVNCTSGPSAANTARQTMTTGKENHEPGTSGTSNTTNQRKRRANQSKVDQSILSDAKKSRSILGTIMSGISKTHGTSKY